MFLETIIKIDDDNWDIEIRWLENLSTGVNLRVGNWEQGKWEIE